MKYNLFIIFFVFSLSSCINKKIIPGSYFDKSLGHELVLEINLDTTFLYLCKGCMSWDSISGNWRLSNRKLTLNSFLSLENTCSFFEEKICDTCQDGIDIKVIDFESKADIQGAIISTFKQGNIFTKVTTNNKGIAVIKDQKIDSVRVDYVGFDSIVFTPNDDTQKLFVINMKSEELSRAVITNEVWKVKKGKIVSPKGFILKKQ